MGENNGRRKHVNFYLHAQVNVMPMSTSNSTSCLTFCGKRKITVMLNSRNNNNNNNKEMIKKWNDNHAGSLKSIGISQFWSNRFESFVSDSQSLRISNRLDTHNFELVWAVIKESIAAMTRSSDSIGSRKKTLQIITFWWLIEAATISLRRDNVIIRPFGLAEFFYPKWSYLWTA